jgi:hypothetical protein
VSAPSRPQQIDEQCGHRLGAHAGAAVGVQREHAAFDGVTRYGLVDELFGQVGALSLDDQPA